MGVIADMLDSGPPRRGKAARRELPVAVKAAVTCAQACTACAAACLAEPAIGELVDCVGITVACAEICTSTARVLTRCTAPDKDLDVALVKACIAACRAGARLCGAHADEHEHCRVCAESCHRCELVCGELLDALS
jgi:hypothetical protein